MLKGVVNTLVLLTLVLQTARRFEVTPPVRTLECLDTPMKAARMLSDHLL